MIGPYRMPGVLGEIERLTCTEVAVEIAHRWGGLQLYIPHDVDRDHSLSRVAGKKAADLLCSSQLAGKLHHIPAARNILRANEAYRLYLEDNLGFTEISIRLGVTRRHVQDILEGVQRPDPAQPRPEAAVPDRCPVCGRRRVSARHPDPRQMALPIQGA